MANIAIFGAGIAGLSAAHELARRGHQVDIYESLSECGGFFRSGRQAQWPYSPTEYSWHGFGPWYHNTFDLLRQIPSDESHSLYETGLSRPIDFGLAPDHGRAQFNDGWIMVPVSRMFQMRGFDSWRWGWLMLKTWSAHQRSREQYARISAAEAWRPLLSRRGWLSWRACFGPWIGSDWTNVSLHQAGEFFRKQLTSQPRHSHPADRDGPAWTQGAGDGWVLLTGPSSECWFDRWVVELERHGVRFHYNHPLEKLEFDGHRITSAEITGGRNIRADWYISAVNPFSMVEILRRTPQLEAQDQLRLFAPLVQRGPHVQVSFRLAFQERIRWPRPRTALILSDSEFNLTMFACEQVWRSQAALGAGVKSLWTGTACVSTVPGRRFGVPLERCTRAQFQEEVQTQILACDSLDQMIREANDGRSLRSFRIASFEVWHEWQFSPAGIRSPQPKWVNTTQTQAFQPTQITPVPNLLLAGAHTSTAADVWSIEAAVESGRRAAQKIEPGVTVLPQYVPIGLRILRRLDDGLYRLGWPHLLDLLVVLGLILGLVAIALGLMMVSGPTLRNVPKSPRASAVQSKDLSVAVLCPLQEIADQTRGDRGKCDSIPAESQGSVQAAVGSQLTDIGQPV